MACRIPCLALALYLCSSGHTLSAALKSRKRVYLPRPALVASDGESDDWFEDISKFDAAILGVEHAARSGGPKTPPKSARSAWCARSRHIVPSPEDLLARRKKCSNKHVLRRREFNKCGNGYGRYIRNAKDDVLFYVEIPKTGSSSVKSMIKEHLDTTGLRIPRGESDVGGTRAFAFVRHPVTRFVSGYGTIINRTQDQGDLGPHLRFLQNMTEPQRFNKFVELFVKHGTRILQWYTGPTRSSKSTSSWAPGNNCVFHHVMSQTWFLNFWPGPVQLYDVDNFADEVRKLGAFAGLNLTLPQVNQHEGSHLVDRDVIMQQNRSLQLLHEYFRTEMSQFGYKSLLS